MFKALKRETLGDDVFIITNDAESMLRVELPYHDSASIDSRLLLTLGRLDTEALEDVCGTLNILKGAFSTLDCFLKLHIVDEFVQTLGELVDQLVQMNWYAATLHFGGDLGWARYIEA